MYTCEVLIRWSKMLLCRYPLAQVDELKGAAPCACCIPPAAPNGGGCPGVGPLRYTPVTHARSGELQGRCMHACRAWRTLQWPQQAAR